MNLKHFFLLCSMLLILNRSSAQTFGWTQATTSPTNTSRNDDIYFVDPTNGWAVSGGGNTNVGAGTGGGAIWKTTNGGITWTKKFEKLGTHFRSIGFVSSMRGFAGNLGPGSYDGYCSDTNVLYQTTDGGENWTTVPALNAAGMQGFCAFNVLDSQHIYGGGRVRGPAYFVKSEDAGTNWTVVNLTAMGVMNGIMDVYFRDSTNGFVVGMDTNSFASGVYHGCIAKTTNGGATWTPVVIASNISTCYFWKMSWPTHDIGYASLQKNPNWTTPIVFYKTIDGGNTWTSNSIPLSALGGNTSFYVQGIGFVNENEGWIGGDSSTTASYSRNFLHTLNGGATWTTNGYVNTLRINRVRFLNPAYGYAAGAMLHNFRLPLALGSQPQNQWATMGTTVNFSIAAYGNAPFSYQWKINGTNLLNATNAALNLTNVVRTNSGVYSVLVSNSSTNLISSNATLRVLVPQKILSPQNLSNKVQLLFGDADGGPLTTNELNNFEVQASTNLSDWDPLTNTLVLTNGLMLIQDDKNSPQKFYRVLDR
jgi:photosystem II stability/assembly factor-like uncharacterized protein